LLLRSCDDTFDSEINNASESANDDEVRLKDGIEQNEAPMDKGEVGESSEFDSESDSGVRLVSQCNKGTGGGFLCIESQDGCLREMRGSSANNEALAEVVGEKDPDAL